MADNCYYWVNGQIKVDYLKIDTNVNLSYKEALTNVKKMQTTTILLKDFVRENFQNNNGTTTTNNGIVCSHIPHTVPQIDKIKVNNGTKIISLPFIFINNLPIPASSALVLLTKTIMPFIDNKKIVILAVPFLNGR